jgi:hypothetical protein
LKFLLSYFIDASCVIDSVLPVFPGTEAECTSGASETPGRPEKVRGRLASRSFIGNTGRYLIDGREKKGELYRDELFGWKNDTNPRGDDSQYEPIRICGYV